MAHPELRAKLKSVYVVDFRALNRVVNDVFRRRMRWEREYRFEHDTDSHKDVSRQYEVDMRGPQSILERDALAEYLRRGPGPRHEHMTGWLLYELCTRGHINPGTYLIHVQW